MVDVLPPHTPYPRWEVTGTATEGYITINVMQSGNIDVKQEYKLGDNTLLKTLQAISTYVKQEPSSDPDSMETSMSTQHTAPPPAATATTSAASTAPSATEEARRGHIGFPFSSEDCQESGEHVACQITIALKENSAFSFGLDERAGAPSMGKSWIAPTPSLSLESEKSWIPGADDALDLWPEHSFRVKTETEEKWGEGGMGDSVQMENEEIEDDDDDSSSDSDSDIDRFRQLLLESKLDSAQIALLKGLPVMTLDNLIARRDFSEEDMKRLMSPGETSSAPSTSSLTPSDIMNKFLGTKSRRRVGKDRKGPGWHKSSSDPWLKSLAFTCKKCGQKFENCDVHEEHEKQCKTEIVKCTECDEIFDSALKLSEHMSSEHSDLTWSCKFCSDKFSRKKFLMVHVRTAHDQRPFKCEKCDKRFESEQNLKIHEKMHDKKKKHRCEVCGNFYSSSTALNTHMELHTMKEKPFKCDKCTSAFYNKHQLKSHIKMVHEEPSKCKICRAPLRGAPAVIRKHMLNVHGEKYLYECNVCDKKFEALYELNAHKKSHTQSFQCTLCGKIFAHKRNYIQHMKRHTGTPTYKCDECGEMFVTNDAKCKHVKNKHSKDKKLNSIWKQGAVHEQEGNKTG